MKINRKQALMIVGSWMAFAMGRTVYSKENEPERKFNGFGMHINQPITVSFSLNQYKRIIINYGDESIELDPKEVFEALKHPPK